MPKPTLEEPGDALVRVTTTAICGSDLHVLNGRIPGMTPGGILGHEFIGVVEAVTPEVKRFAEGDRVLASFTILCGRCWFCARRLFSRCPEEAVIGDLNGWLLDTYQAVRTDWRRVAEILDTLANTRQEYYQVSSICWIRLTIS